MSSGISLTTFAGLCDSSLRNETDTAKIENDRAQLQVPNSLHQTLATSGLNSGTVQKLPELKLSPATAFVNEALFTRIEIPENLKLKNPQLIMLSPILGPVDIKKSGLVEVQYTATLNPKNNEDKASDVCGLADLSPDNKFIKEYGTVNAVTGIEIRSLKPIPSSINLHGQTISTAFKFPIIITDQGKPVAKSSIEISIRKLKSEEQGFMQEIEKSFTKGSFTATYPTGSAQPRIKIKYNQAPKFGKLQAGLKELWKNLTRSKEANALELIEGLFDTKNSVQRRLERDASTDYLNIEIFDDHGQTKSRFNAWGDYLGMPNRWGSGIMMRAWDGGYDSGSIGGRAGPIFNSALEFARYVLNNFAFADQEKFAPQFTAQKPNHSMSKEREIRRLSQKVAGTPLALAV